MPHKSVLIALVVLFGSHIAHAQQSTALKNKVAIAHPGPINGIVTSSGKLRFL